MSTTLKIALVVLSFVLFARAASSERELHTETQSSAVKKMKIENVKVTDYYMDAVKHTEEVMTDTEYKDIEQSHETGKMEKTSNSSNIDKRSLVPENEDPTKVTTTRGDRVKS